MTNKKDAWPHWRPAYIGIGSNLEQPVQQVQRAVAAIDALEHCSVFSRSANYQSAPLRSAEHSAPDEQPDYVNAVAAALTTLDAPTLLANLQEIERNQGRVRGAERWGPRTLDLDLLVFSDQRIDDPGLIVPHPGIAQRNFVLLPLAEIAPELSIPGLGTVAMVLANNDNSTPAITKLD